MLNGTGTRTGRARDGNRTGLELNGEWAGTGREWAGTGREWAGTGREWVMDGKILQWNRKW